MFWDNVMERFAIIGYEESPRGDAEYGFYQYFRQYTDTIRVSFYTLALICLFMNSQLDWRENGICIKYCWWCDELS